MDAEEIRADRPYSEARGAVDVDGVWLLTHVIWHPMMPWGGHGCAPETGVRFLKEPDAKGRPRFELIQHGWSDFRRAQNVIERGLRKGWQVDRIAAVMDRVKPKTSTAVI
jgi:hypothetical protein